jgi:hypothetical protein
VPAAPPATADGASSLDDLIASASKQVDATTASSKAVTPPTAAPNSTEPAEDKSAPKKDKEKEKPKATRLVYSDNETSPEEKMALLGKYAFTPLQKSVVV